MTRRDQAGEVWVIEWKNFDDNVLLILGEGDRIDEYRCLDLETGQVDPWPCDMFEGQTEMRRRVA